jgi:hypothetical protein
MEYTRRRRAIDALLKTESQIEQVETLQPPTETHPDVIIPPILPDINIEQEFIRHAKPSGMPADFEKARPYQMKLFQRAKDQNIIAVLDTGAGKVSSHVCISGIV